MMSPESFRGFESNIVLGESVPPCLRGIHQHRLKEESGQSRPSDCRTSSMSRILFSVIMLFAATLGFGAETAPDAVELTKLLKEFLAGASRNDIAVHERFWADDLIYTGSVGRRVGKADILRDVRKEGPQKEGDEITIYTAEDIRIQQYGETAIVAFRLVGTTEKAGKKEVKNYLNSGTFLKRKGKWQVVNWQATVLPNPTPTPAPTATP